MSHSAPKIAPREGIIDAVAAAIGDAFVEAKDVVDEVSITIRRESLVDVMRTLRDQFEYQQLMEIAGVDYPSRQERFEVVYHLTSLNKQHTAILKTRLDGREELTLPSVYHLWRGADYQEREIWDLMGISFSGHPNMKRIMLWEGFEGHPLRKDYL